MSSQGCKTTFNPLILHCLPFFRYPHTTIAFLSAPPTPYHYLHVHPQPTITFLSPPATLHQYPSFRRCSRSTIAFISSLGTHPALSCFPCHLYPTLPSMPPVVAAGTYTHYTHVRPVNLANQHLEEHARRTA